jgi:hypothetical protein
MVARNFRGQKLSVLRMGRVLGVVVCCLVSACGGERSISTRVRQSETASRVSGFLVDGEGRALTVAAVFINGEGIPEGGPVADGHFVFDNLAPGDYVVNAWNYDSDLSGYLTISLEPGEQLDGVVLDVTTPSPDALLVSADEPVPTESQPPEESEPPQEDEAVVTRTVRVVNLDADGGLVGLLVRHVDSSWQLGSGTREFIHQAPGPGSRTSLDVRVADRETSVCPDVHGDYLFDCVVVQRGEDVAYIRYLHGARIRGVLRGAPESARVSCDRYQALVSEHGQFAINCPEHAPLVIDEQVAVWLPTRVGQELFVEIAIELR